MIQMAHDDSLSGEGDVNRSYTSTCCISKLLSTPSAAASTTTPCASRLPRTSATRLAASQPSSSTRNSNNNNSNNKGVSALSEEIASSASRIENGGQQTVLYLAYGSNLCAETFLGKRGIKPLSAVNVLCPSLELTFDLPGIPYTEPCFANTARRQQGHGDEKAASPGVLREVDGTAGTRADGDPVWPHGLVGVVYEVTAADYAHIIATEGGGASYQDIEVLCYVLKGGSDSNGAPSRSSEGFLAHTLFAPYQADEGSSATCSEQEGKHRHIPRPSPTWAQPSARYLKLLTDGAAEHALPSSYQAYLSSLQPYTITTKKQRVGQVVLLATFGPFLALLLGLARIFKDDKGRVPGWLAWLTAALFQGVWGFYDDVLKKVFGEGERTVEGRKARRGRGVGRKGHAMTWQAKEELGNDEETAGLLETV